MNRRVLNQMLQKNEGRSMNEQSVRDNNNNNCNMSRTVMVAGVAFEQKQSRTFQQNEGLLSLSISRDNQSDFQLQNQDKEILIQKVDQQSNTFGSKQFPLRTTSYKIQSIKKQLAASEISGQFPHSDIGSLMDSNQDFNDTAKLISDGRSRTQSQNDTFYKKSRTSVYNPELSFHQVPQIMNQNGDTPKTDAIPALLSPYNNPFYPQRQAIPAQLAVFQVEETLREDHHSSRPTFGNSGPFNQSHNQSFRQQQQAASGQKGSGYVGGGGGATHSQQLSQSYSRILTQTKHYRQLNSQQKRKGAFSNKSQSVIGNGGSAFMHVSNIKGMQKTGQSPKRDMCSQVYESLTGNNFDMEKIQQPNLEPYKTQVQNTQPLKNSHQTSTAKISFALPNEAQSALSFKNQEPKIEITVVQQSSRQLQGSISGSNIIIQNPSLFKYQRKETAHSILMKKNNKTMKESNSRCQTSQQTVGAAPLSLFDSNLIIRGNKNGFVTKKDQLYNVPYIGNQITQDDKLQNSNGFQHTSILNSNGFFDLKAVIVGNNNKQ